MWMYSPENPCLCAIFVVLKKMIKHITWLVAVLFMMPVFNVSSQQCDPVILEKAVDNEYLKYRERENRCEGFYGSEVSSQYRYSSRLQADRRASVCRHPPEDTSGVCRISGS